MSDLKDFVSGQNVDRFLDQLAEPLEPQRRGLILELMIAEEDRLGHSREQLELARQRVVDGAARIRRQKTLVACYPPDSRSGLQALDLLAALEQTQTLIEGYYERQRRSWLEGNLALGERPPSAA